MRTPDSSWLARFFEQARIERQCSNMGRVKSSATLDGAAGRRANFQGGDNRAQRTNTEMNLQSSAPLPEGAEIGAYRILHALSSGGFSIVYLAYSEQSEECVAIKEYMPADRALRRPGELVPYIGAEHIAHYKYGLAAFFQEARILAAINHPNIVQVLELVRANETIYMVMQFIEGTSLEKYILRHRVQGHIAVLPEDFIVGVLAQRVNHRGNIDVHVPAAIAQHAEPAKAV